MSVTSEKSYRILSADYVLSVHGPDQFAGLSLPEVAFVGKSNVGKSTLINALCNRRSLAVTGKTPGRTRALNYFSVRMEESNCDSSRDVTLHFVDFPGYGYAKVAKSERKRWNRLIGSYFERHNLVELLCLLHDSRRELSDEEKWFTTLGVPLVVVLTKADQLNRQAVSSKKREVAEELGLPQSQVLETALIGKKKYGVPKLINFLGRRISEAME